MKSSKVCPKCGIISPLDNFYKSSVSLSGLQSWCKQCSSDSTRESDFKLKYGLTVSLYYLILKEQDNKCDCCDKIIYSKDESPKQTLTAHVDHCHKTGRIRGLLCGACNSGIGHLGDNKEGLERALAYVSQTIDVRYRNGRVASDEDTHDRDDGPPDTGNSQLLLSLRGGKNPELLE